MDTFSIILLTLKFVFEIVFSFLGGWNRLGRLSKELLLPSSTPLPPTLLLSNLSLFALLPLPSLLMLPLNSLCFYPLSAWKLRH